MSEDRTLSERLASELAAGDSDLDKSPTVAAIPNPTEDLVALARSVRALKSAVDVLLGAGSSAMDKALTARDLLREGVIEFNSSTGITTSVPPPSTTPAAGWVDPRPVMEIPPTPTGLIAIGATTTIYLEWVLINYRNHAFTEIWRTDVLGGPLTLYDTADGLNYVDTNVNPNVTYYYRVRAVNLEDVAGEFSALPAAEASVDDSIVDILALLTGQITESQLYQTLNDRIDLIDGDGAGSVNERIDAAVANSGVGSRTFYSATAPVSDVNYTLRTNDSWFDSDDGNKHYRWDGDSWEEVTDGRLPGLVTDLSTETTNRINGDNAEINIRTSLYAGVSATGASGYKIFNQATEPTGLVAADIGAVWTWKTAAGVETFMRWSGTAWVDSIANKRAAIYRGQYASAPTGSVIGDVYLNTTDKLTYVYNGATWINFTSTNPVNALVDKESLVRTGETEALAEDITTLQASLAVGGDTYESIVQVNTIATSKSATFTQSATPTATKTGDLWVDTGNGNILKRWDGDSWELADDQRIGTQATQITTLQSTVSGAGANLLPNSSFEFDSDSNGLADGWLAYSSGVISGAARAINTAARVHGAKSQKFSVASSGGASTDRVGVYCQIPVPSGYAGKTYTYSGSMAGTSGATGLLYFDFRDAASAAIGGSSAQAVFTLTGTSNFERKSATKVSVPAGATYIRAHAWVYGGGGGAIEASVDALQLQEGELTAYQTPDSSVALEQEMTTRADETGNLFGQYTVKIDNNGYVSGFGLASTTVDGTPFSDFQIRADRFSITNPAGTLATINTLTRSSTTATMTTATAHGLVVGDDFSIRGVTNDTNWNAAFKVLTQPNSTQVTFTVPSTLTTPATGASMKATKAMIPFIVSGGVPYLNGARLLGGSVQGAAISDGTIEGSKLINVSFNHLTGGSLAVSSYMQSTSYIQGVSGWRVNADGTAEFGATSIRGQLTASQIDTRNLTIKDASGNIIFGASNDLDFSRLLDSSVPSSLKAEFTEDFGYLTADPRLAKWVEVTGTGVELTTQVSTTSVAGGYELKAGNSIGNDQAWLVHADNIPYDPTALYRIRIRVRRSLGTGTFYAGVNGVARDGVTMVNTAGSNSNASQHYVVAAGEAPGTVFTEYVGYLRGTGATGTGSAKPDPDLPGVLHQNAAYIRPMMLFNYQNLSGIYYVDYFIIEKLAGAMGAIDQITAAKASTYIASAAIDLAHIKTASITNLSALNANTGTLTVSGALTVGTSGNIKSGKGSYTDDTAGFWLGMDSTTPKFYIGSAAAHMKWDGSQLLLKSPTSSGVVPNLPSVNSEAGLNGASGTAYAYVYINSDGTISRKANTGSFFTVTGANWYNPTTSGIGTTLGVYARVQKVGGSAALYGNVDTWKLIGGVNNTSSVSCYVQNATIDTTVTAYVKVDIADSSAGTNIIATGFYTLSASRTNIA